MNVVILIPLLLITCTAMAESKTEAMAQNACSVEHVVNQAQQWLSEHLSVSAIYQPLRSTTLPSALRDCNAGLQFSETKVGNGRIALTTIYRDELGKSRTTTLWFYGYQDQQVFSVTRRLRPGDEIAADDIAIEIRRVKFGEHDNLVSSPVGQLALKELRKGSIVRTADVRSKPLIKRGEKIRVELIGDGVRVVVEAKSDSDIYADGQTLKLRLDGQTEAIDATWRKEGVAHVRL